MQLTDEFERVFNSVNYHEGQIYADGWPESIQYDSEIAISVLSKFEDGYGNTEKGDAEVCEALEQANAVI